MVLAQQCTEMADFSSSEMLDGSLNECFADESNVLGALERRVMTLLSFSSSETHGYILGDLASFSEVLFHVGQYTQPLQCSPSLLSAYEYKKPSLN